MLKFKEVEGVEGRYVEVDQVVDEWRAVSKTVPRRLRDEFHSRLQISLIYHDSALEGVILTHGEIKAAIDPTIISHRSLIPSYESIKQFDDACQFATEFATGKGAKKRKLNVDTLREMCAILTSGEDKITSYRKDNPLHRLYYHEICPPEKISYRMRKFAEWLDGSAPETMHPVEFAATMHKRLMHIFPWAKRSGKVARIATNLVLAKANYPAAIIHSIDRQRYYEALRGDGNQLISVLLEAVETTAKSELQVYDEAINGTLERRHA